IKNNTITDNQVAGISLLDSGENEILSNDISSNMRFGIQIQGRSDGNTVVGNNITQSPTGIFVESNSNIFYSNYLIDNVVQAVDRGENIWNAPYPAGGNAWSDYTGADEHSGPAQDVPGADGFGDTPREISNRSRDMYPVMGYELRPIRIMNASVPEEIEAGEQLLIKAWIESLNGLSQVSARIPESRSYVRLYQAGDHYEGSLTTALLDPGEYSVVITATDRRGYELEEAIGKFRITPRAGRSFEAAMAQLRGRS
uniref:NosD domain-containing protein n=1 Tax=Methanothrix sp. TaxID=90426 RepID=UPI0034E26E4A